MKYKNKLIFFSLLVFQTAFSQEWAPIGSKWYYDSMDNGASPPSSSYILYESIKDSLINGITCKKLKIIFFSAEYGIVEKTPEYMYSDSGKVYYFWNNDFKLLYDFNANTGDTIKVFNRLVPNTNPYNITDFAVDSTKLFKDVFPGSSFFAIDSLKVQYIRPVSTHGYNLSFGYNVIVENIGSVDLMFPTSSVTIPEKDGPLRCFQYDTAWFKWVPFECDYWVTSINDISNKNHNNLTICPNPFQTTATIKLENYKNENLTLKIYNVYGQTLRTMKIKQNETTLEKNNLTTGIYLYQLTDKEKIIGQGKFIIE